MAEELVMVQPGQGDIQLKVSALNVVNYALQQNGVSMLRSINIINNTGMPLEDVQLHISTVPEFCFPMQKHFSLIPAGSTFSAGSIRPQLNGEYLAGLTEKLTGTLHVALKRGDETLCMETQEITVLAYDQWHGSRFYPELLCAFVTPNHPDITRVTTHACDLLGKWTGDPSLDAYQTQDPNRVLAQAAAVYGALQAQDIVYSVPPASFEPAGQRIRLCDAVLTQKLGTCLDLSLLYAGCLEAIGLHPILVLKSGHIFCGVWLEELTFPECVQDDVSLVRKRLADGIHELAVVECTAMTSGKHMSFDQARSEAEQLLKDVEYILDVKRARLSGVSPLPLRIRTESDWQIQHPQAEPQSLTAAPQALQSAPDTASQSAEVKDKRTQWERKLLDLGLRNTLISMRLTGSIVPILATSLDALENTLNSGKDFSVLPRPADYRSENKPGFENIHDLAGCEALIDSEFSNRRLRSVYTDTELSKSLKNLYRTAKTSLEENGANTLYLALGLLKWYETPKSTKARFAPVILLPVEMVRKSAAQGYVIRLRDDDPHMNITILEKLKQDFGITVLGLDPLPQDEQGIDTRKVFTILRKAIMDQPKWDVLESAYLGIFSFSQFVMWNDIRNRYRDLERNKIVRSLMDGKLCWEAEPMRSTLPDEKQEVFLPMSADASQLLAIASAARGESFVLHGPPGTGKSQTITTMIANALAQGKSVLFVAEKMAALEVVQKRLEKIGIGPFCLELHSNKAKKRTVLEQLRRASEVTRNTTAEEFAVRTEQIAKLRTQLDAYATDLHKSLRCGRDLFELVCLYEENATAPDIEPPDSEFIRGITSEDLVAQEALVERMIAAAKAVEHPHNHPLESVCCTQYSQQIRYALPKATGTYRQAIDVLNAALEHTDLGEPTPMTLAQIRRTVSIARELKKWLSLPGSWAILPDPRRCLLDTKQMAQHRCAAMEIKNALSNSWTEDFLSADAETLCKEWDEAAGKWFLPKLTGQNRVLRQLKPFAKTPLNKDTLRADLEQLRAYQKELSAANTLFAACGDSLGQLYNGNDTDYSAVLTAAVTALESSEALHALDADTIRKEYGGKATHAPMLTALTDAWDGFTAAKASLYDLLSLSDDPEAENYLSYQQTLCRSVTEHSDGLKDWIAFNSICEEAAEMGIGFIADAYRGGIRHEDILRAYRKAVSKLLAIEAIDASQALNTFSGAVFNEKVRQFKRLDEEVTRLTQKEIFCRLAAKVPDFTKEAAQSSELGILQRAIRSGGRGVSLRKLFEQLPNLLPRLCPCMLMSPISAAQYLDPDREPFDLVVFDEASQLPTCKAVGALARGSNAVVVGDPKQMPPTAFFVSNTVDEEALDTEDLESILDDCLAMSIPQTHLLWHYRSRHESLIAFSNSHFYENKLYTFPSVNDRATKVSLVHVDGVFERGKQRQNRAEAEAVVAELKRRCYDETQRQYSVGVVTFNISQQHLIDDLLGEACREDPQLDAWVYQSQEPVFIKNLENVQGDERDVILFSIGYGPDEHGKVYMNFGPLNRDGGWRRLNVAITRSRQEMIVFATLRPEQIDLSRSSAEGVSALKAFLEYAESQQLPVDENSIIPDETCMGIAHTICRFLEENGYETDCQVGHSKYRIDIGVIDPKDPESYCLGILLDGDSYDASKLTRDREIAQISVLSGLGWKTTRVWTMDWWDNSRRELERILALLKKPESAPKEEVPLPEVPEVLLSKNISPKEVNCYTPAALAQNTLSSEDFLLPKYTAAIRNKITAVMTKEAPISRSLLTRRIVQSYGISRAGSRIQAHLDSIYKAMKLKTTEQSGEVFYWMAHQDPDSYRSYRPGTTEADRRDARDIPVQEAAGAICQVLKDQISLSQDDLIREGAKLMGYTRLGSAVTPLFCDAIRYAQEKGFITTGTNGNHILAETP